MLNSRPQVVPRRPYVLAFMVDAEVERELRASISPSELVVVRDVQSAQRVLRSPAPAALVVVGLELDSETGVAVGLASRRSWPRVPMVLLSRERSSWLEHTASELGAEGLMHPGDVATLVSGLRAHARRGARAREAQRILAAIFAARWHLSERQHECIRLLAYGVAQSDLPDRLRISTRAVDQHLRNIRERCHEEESCGLVQRLLELVLEVGIHGEQGWLLALRDWEPT